MKVFISWSGELSQKVATILRDWIPNVIQVVEPYVSAEDIDKGARWGSDIASELEDSSFGILCITQSNKEAPWLLFEAGALSKKLNSSFVCPFLFRVKNSDIKGPLVQFQSTSYKKDDVFKLVKSINNVCGGNRLEDARLEKVFERWWVDLQEQLDGLTDDDESSEKSTQIATTGVSKENEILEEILELSRINHNLLRSPEVIFPPEYLKYIFKNDDLVGRMGLSRNVIKDYIVTLRDLERYLHYYEAQMILGETHVEEMKTVMTLIQNHIRPSKQIAKRLRIDSREFVSENVILSEHS